MANKKRAAREAAPPAPPVVRSTTSPVRVPDELLVEVDAVSALSAATSFHMPRAAVLAAAVREGLPRVREEVVRLAAEASGAG